ncbi:urate hydroxylase PuuD [Pseudoroseicyclus sp. CXY001]|uniref:urate hydroxylase PuuD n=1 Tax=Pseudoroseicyclus sp. CXY001 TaxID=3242492 RepID=UPI003570F936
MYDWVLILEWVKFAVRWLHVITAIAWIGSSFYFIALDLGLHRDRKLASGADGEEWQVHGGGFYHIQKYLVAPANMPDDLVWFKWESYATWLSGFAMLFLVYYIGGEIFLIDPEVLDIPVWVGALISMASLGFGWVVYDQICKRLVTANQTLVMLLLFAVLVGMALFYANVFSGRAALLHLGAFTASIMSGNVFFTIIPNQKVVTADLVAGRTPDPKYGKIAKQRSTHNNYLTLPVIFLMLSNHYPMAFASELNWLIATLVFLMGVTIRHFFNTMHARKGHPHWALGLTAVIFVAIIWLSSPRAYEWREDEAAIPAGALRYAEAEGFDEVHQIVMGRCAMCHAAEPSFGTFQWPPKGVMLETAADIAIHAEEIYLQAGITHAMPPANLSYMEEAERAAIVRWVRAARGMELADAG